MSLQAQIQEVLKKKSVLEYLAKRGHVPFKTMGAGRSGFLCPFPDHKESKPSFVVYTNAEYENWYCYGCNRGHNIIHLVSYLDNISFRDALSRISDGIIVTAEDELNFILEKIQKEDNKLPQNKMGNILLTASWQCLLFCQGVNFDKNEVKKVDEYFALLDTYIGNLEIDKIEASTQALSGVLKFRREQFNKKRVLTNE